MPVNRHFALDVRKHRNCYSASIGFIFKIVLEGRVKNAGKTGISH